MGGGGGAGSGGIFGLLMCVADYGFPFQGYEPVPTVPSDPWKGLGREPGEGSHDIRFPGGNPNVPTIRFFWVLKRGKVLPCFLPYVRQGCEEDFSGGYDNASLCACVDEVFPREFRLGFPEIEGGEVGGGYRHFAVGIIICSPDIAERRHAATFRPRLGGSPRRA